MVTSRNSRHQFFGPARNNSTTNIYGQLAILGPPANSTSTNNNAVANNNGQPAISSYFISLPGVYD